MLQLDFGSQRFLKQFTVYGSFDGMVWESVGSYQLFQVDEISRTGIQLPSPLKYNFYRLVVLQNLEKVSVLNFSLVSTQKNNQWLDFQKMRPAKFQISKVNNDTVLTFDNSDRVWVKQLRLQIAGGNFKRQFEVDDVDHATEVETENNEIYNLKFQDVAIADTSVHLLTPSNLKMLTLKIFNHDDQPLAITQVFMDFLIDRVVFEDNGNDPYRVCFGNSNTVKPVYDIEQYRGYIEKSVLNPVNLGPLQIQSKVAQPMKMGLDFKMLFNGVIILVAFLLGIFLLRNIMFKLKEKA